MNDNFTSICGGLAMLTPLVFALGKWNVELAKLKAAQAKKALKAQSSTNSTTDTTDSDHTRFSFGVLLQLILAFLLLAFGMFQMYQLAKSTEPLTTGTAAKIAISALWIYMGYFKPRL